MKGITRFYTLFWVVYFPVCIAFTHVVKFDFSDELLCILLLLYAITKTRFIAKEKKKTGEIKIYIAIMLFYIVYSFVIDITTPRGIWLDILQQIRPYTVFYLTWMLAPQFTRHRRNSSSG